MSMAQEACKRPTGGRDRFTTEPWSVVLSAGRGEDARSSEALARLCQTCWYPLCAFVRRRFGELLREEVAQTVAGPKELAEEMGPVVAKKDETLAVVLAGAPAGGALKGVGLTVLPLRGSALVTDRDAVRA
jgi:hypothetical protein